MTDTCVWEQQEWDGDQYSTECGREFCMVEGTPLENGFKFCVWCGRPLFEVLIVVPEEDKKP